MTEVTKETVQKITDGISQQGDGYWLTQYAQPKHDGTDLDNAMQEAILALNKFHRILSGYIEKFEVEWS